MQALFTDLQSVPCPLCAFQCLVLLLWVLAQIIEFEDFLITLVLFSLCLYAIYPPHSQHPCCLPCQHKLRLSTTGHSTDNYEHTDYLTRLISSWKHTILEIFPQIWWFFFFFNPCWSRHPLQASKLALGKVWSCHSCCLTATPGLPPFWMTSTSFDNLSHSTLRSDCRIVYQTRYLSWLASRLKRFKRVSMVTKYSLWRGAKKERETEANPEHDISSCFTSLRVHFFLFRSRCTWNITWESLYSLTDWNIIHFFTGLYRLSKDAHGNEMGWTLWERAQESKTEAAGLTQQQQLRKYEIMSVNNSHN